ncbi:MAG: apolipoprotein N-acyltransferase [Gloeocapsa sp. UFS-A4-WI-NPMV-4B04]|nr:apolipoprotein N-acyltransferase [Gloeocapsa sp. UFS-A4-WI-NPMV-4B04]
MGFTVAPVGAWFLAWIALAPLWVLVVGSTNQEKHSLPLLPLVWGIGYHGVAISWIVGIHPMTWMGVPWLASLAITLFCWVFLTLWGAALVAAWAVGMSIFGRSVGVFARVLIGVALWCSLESLWSAGALWWTSISYTQSPHNLVILHLGQLSGPFTVTAALVAVNGLIAEAWIQGSGIRDQGSGVKSKSSGFWLLASGCGLLVGLHLVGFGLYSRPLIQPPETALKVGIIQGNVPNEIKLYPEGWQRAIEGYTRGYRTLASLGIDAVLTPEGALPFFQTELMRSSFVSAVKEKGVVAWIGGFGEQEGSYTNSLFTITSRGEIFSRYNKVKLVPLGEYIPFEQFLGSLINRLSPLEAHQVAGVSDQVFDTPFGRAIASICYESAFAAHLRRQAAEGGQFILSAANNAHYSPAMPAQHHAQDVMRAIESDRWAVRATNTGYSGIVDPHGRTQWLSRLNTYELHAATIYRRQTQTLYVRWGDWLTPMLLILAALAWWFNATSRRSPS